MRTTVTRGRTVKTVLVEGITDESNDEIFAAALRGSGETTSSIFGWRLSRDLNDPTRAVVTLDID